MLAPAEVIGCAEPVLVPGVLPVPDLVVGDEEFFGSSDAALDERRAGGEWLTALSLPAIGAVVNAASFAKGISPRSLETIFGVNLAGVEVILRLTDELASLRANLPRVDKGQ